MLDSDIFAVNEHEMLWELVFRKDALEKNSPCRIASGAIYQANRGRDIFRPHTALIVCLKIFSVIYLYMMLIEFFNLPHHLDFPIEDRHGPVPYYEQATYSEIPRPFPEPSVPGWC